MTYLIRGGPSHLESLVKINSDVVLAKRKSLGLPQSSLAKKANLHLSTVGLAERNGRVSEAAARAIAKALNCALHEISAEAKR